jgi:TIR domain
MKRSNWMAHDVFISHAHKDKSIADAIREKLESSQVRCWIATRDISAGENCVEATRNAIRCSHVIVFVLSENANAAPHIERELAHAFYTGRTIIPLRLANTLPRRDFLFYLGSGRWFNASGQPAEHHLEALTASVKSLVPDRTVTSNAMLLQTPRETRLNSLNSRIGALRASHYRTLGVLKWVTIAAFLSLVVWLLCFAPRHAKEGVPLVDSNFGSTSSGPGASSDSLPQARQDTSASKTMSTFTRFGLWEPPHTGPTPLAQPVPQDTLSTTAAVQPAAATPSPQSDVYQKAAGEAERSATQHSASVKSAQENPPRTITPAKPAGLISSWESHGHRLPPSGMPPAPDYERQQYQAPDRNITWRSWQQLPAYEVRIRTGDRYLGGENWAHYLGFELAATSQKVIKVSLIHLEGEMSADMELSTAARDGVVKIVNHHMTTPKGAWGWTLQAEPPNTGPPPMALPGPQDTPSTTAAVQFASAPPSQQPEKAAAEAEKLAIHPSASVKPTQEDATRITAPGQPAELTSVWESHTPPLPSPGMPPAPHYHHQQYQDPDGAITWHGWQQLQAYEMRIRTGDHYLGGENWAHYLRFELAATSQRMVKVSLIHLEGETAADIEVSPSAREATVKIVNHHMTTPKGAWGWTLQEIKQSGP